MRVALVFRTVVAIAAVGLQWFMFAPAAQAQTNTIAIYVDGPDARPLREAALRAAATVAVADDKAFRAELARAGQKGPLAEALDPKAIKRIEVAGRAIGAAAVLVVRERRDGKVRWVSLIIVDVAEGPSPAKRVRLDLKSQAADSDEIASALGHALDPYAPVPAPPGPALDRDVVAETAPTSAVAPASAYRGLAEVPLRPATTSAQLIATSVFDAALGAGLVGRRFAYANGISPRPFLYNMFPARTAVAMLKVFPFVGARGLWRDIGIAGEYSLTLLSISDLQGALSYTMPTSYAFGLCARVHPAADARFLLGACLGYAVASFGTVGSPLRELPYVTYRSLRPELDARIAFGTFSIVAAAAFRAMVDPQGISALFYNPSGYGIDGEIGGALMYVRRLEARVVARYERYSFAFTPPSGATFAAGNALDQQYGARLSIALVF